MTTVRLALQDVTVDFGEGPLLKRVNLDVQEGEAVVLIGPSGRGKTVVLKLLAGLLKPNSGRVLVDGKDFHALSTREQNETRLKMGMLFQRNALFDSLTVAENIAFPLREVSDLESGEIAARVTQYLHAVGIAHASALTPDEISGGMQKRLGIARALALTPEIVLYDDPTAGLDPITSRHIIDLIQELRRANRSTVVAVTNEMTRAYQLADRIVMVVDGELIVTGSREQTLAHADARVIQFVRGRLHGPLTAETPA